MHFTAEHPVQPATVTEHLPVTEPRPQPRRPPLAPPPQALIGLAQSPDPQPLVYWARQDLGGVRK